MKIINLDEFDVFKGGSEEFLGALAGAAQIKTHPKGKLIILHEEKADRFFIIKRGWVKLFRETLDGTQSIVDILPKNHMFGETAIFQNNQYSYSVEVIEPSEIISLPLSLLKKEIEQNHKVSLNFLKAMAVYRRQQDMEIEHRTIQNAPQRIGCFLLRLVRQDEKGAVKIQLPYDKTLVAARLGMQPETFSRALVKLKEKTGIRVSGATIEIDSLDQLMQYSCVACSSEFPCKDLKVAVT
ncbi:MAG: Crp/Fnr family transcriptional regulator [Alphaproteobacteria bacterium]